MGSIYIPIESEEMREDIGEVMYVGPGAMNDDGETLPMYVKVGDRVLFSTHGHQITKIDGKELIVLRQNSIIGVFRERKTEEYEREAQEFRNGNLAGMPAYDK